MPNESPAASPVARLRWRSRAEVLEELTLQLQPVLQQWHQLRRDMLLDEQQRAEQLHQLERQMRQAGLPRFHRLLREVCRAYCSGRRTQGAEPGFEAEVFAEEVLLLVHERLPQFDPRLASFSTWLAKHVFLKIYRDLQRSYNPTWAQSRPSTAMGLRQHRQAFAIARAQSLDAPARAGADNDDPFTLQEILSSVDNAAEKALLEEYCRERFLQAVLGLSEADQLLLERVHLRGEAKQDVARSLGRTPGRISQKLGEIYRRLAGVLGAQFLEECDGTGFCAALHERVADRPKAGCEAQLERLSQNVPRLLSSSGWTGASAGPPVEPDAEEERLWTHLMALPSPPPPLSLMLMLSTAAVAVAAMVTLAIVRPPGAPVPPPSKLLVARPPERSSASHRSPGSTPASGVPQPTVRTVEAPSRKAAGPARPSRGLGGTDRPQKAPPVSQPASTPALPQTVPVPTPTPNILAGKPPADTGIPAGSAGAAHPQTLPAPQEQILRSSRSGAAAVVAAYGRDLCQALQVAGHWPPGAAQPAVLEITLIAGVKGTRLVQPPRTVVSGGPALDGALLAALTALEGVGWPAWPGASERQLRILVIYDSDRGQLSCQAEAVPRDDGRFGSK
ncbi:RNA polymerase sigma factor [Gloeobacter violaceus]|nr:hypothetical protein [Gloeobacter violaceus]